MSQLDHWDASPTHETRDGMARTGFTWGIVFLLYAAAGAALALGVYRFVAPKPFAGALPLATRQNPQHPLQDNLTSRTDIADLRKHEDELLQTPGPSLYYPGARRIPIDQAIAQLGRSGLPRHPFRPGSYELSPSSDEVRR